MKLLEYLNELNDEKYEKLMKELKDWWCEQCLGIEIGRTLGISDEDWKETMEQQWREEVYGKTEVNMDEVPF